MKVVNSECWSKIMDKMDIQLNKAETMRSSSMSSKETDVNSYGRQPSEHTESRERGERLPLVPVRQCNTSK